MITEEKAIKRKNEIYKIHQVIVAYHKRSWIEQDKYEKYLRILDKIKIDDVEYDDKMHKFRKKVDHIKKMNQVSSAPDSISGNQLDTGKTLKKEAKNMKRNQSTQQPFEMTEPMTKQQEHSILSHFDNENDIEVSFKESSKPHVNVQTDQKESVGLNPRITTEKYPININEMATETMTVPKTMNSNPLKKTKSILKNSKSSPTKLHPSKLSRQDSERVFVEMCVFARLGYLQPPSCLRCAFDEAIHKKVVDSCDNVIAWRKDTSVKLHSDQMENAISFVKCHSAKKWSMGQTLEEVRNSFLTNQ